MGCTNYTIPCQDSSEVSTRRSQKLWNWWSCSFLIASSSTSFYPFPVPNRWVSGGYCSRKKLFVEYVSDIEWYIVSIDLICNQKVKVDEDHIQDVFSLNIFHRDEIKNIVAVERHSAHAYIANQHKDENFNNSIAQMYETLSARHPKAGHNCSQSQSNIHSIILYCMIIMKIQVIIMVLE